MVSFVTKSGGMVGDQRTLAHLLSPLPNGEYAVTVEPLAQWKKRQPRTNDQNALMWAYFTDIARLLNSQCGDDYWSSERLHDYFCSVFSVEDVTPDGVVWRKQLRTSRLTKQQMSEFLTKAQAHLAMEFGMNVPLPGDDDYDEFKRNYT